MEKNVMRSMELVGRERMEVAVCTPKRVLCMSHVTNSLASNNFPSGVKDVMTTSRMSLISLVCLSTKSASLKTSLWIDMTNTG